MLWLIKSVNKHKWLVSYGKFMVINQGKVVKSDE